MSKINVGKVSPVPKGNWGGANAAYDKLNMVNYNGALYIAKQNIEANSNIAITNTEYWMKATNSWNTDVNVTLDGNINTGSGTIVEGNNGKNTLNLTIPGTVYGTEIIDDIAGDGDTNVVWSANKSFDEINNFKNSIIDFIPFKKNIIHDSAESKYIEFIAKSGDNIFISCEGDGTNFWTRATQSGTDLQEFWVPTNSSKVITLTSDCNYIRSYSTGATTITIYNISNMLGELYNTSIRINSTMIKANNYTSLLSDLNNAKDNYIYFLNFADKTDPVINNYPLNKVDSSINVLITYTVNSIKHQTMYTRNCVCLRQKDSSAWNSWKIIYINSAEILNEGYQKGRILLSSGTLYDGYISGNNGNVVTSNDFKCTNYINVSGKKKIGISRGMIQFAYYDANKNFLIGEMVESINHDFAEYTIPNNAYYVRLSGYTQTIDKQYYTLRNDGECPFTDAVIISPDTTTIPDFKTIRAGVQYAIQFPNTKVVIKEGTYNMLTEFANEIAESTSVQYGVGLGNGVHIFAKPGAIINCLYTGSDTNVIKYLSPFYSLKIDGGFTLENVEIHSSNCRYCVHDEYAGTNYIIRNIYKNCHFYHDDRGAGTLLNYYLYCIGIGTGKHTYIDIDGCYFYTKRAESQVTPLVAVHNANVQDSYSKVNVRNSYFANLGTFRCAHYGPSELISVATVSNCSLGAEPIVVPETPDSTTENFALVSFLNEIRN